MTAEAPSAPNCPNRRYAGVENQLRGSPARKERCVADVRVTGTADEIELIARFFGVAPRVERRPDGMMAGYFEVRAPKTICLDLGTTGPNPVEDEIAAIAIVDWAGNVVHEGKYRPSRRELWQAASKVNGVYPDNQMDLPSFLTTRQRLGRLSWAPTRLSSKTPRETRGSWSTTTLSPAQAPESPI